MLDEVERRRFPVDPTGEDSPPLILRAAHVELEKGAGQLLHFPGRGRLAGAQSDDRVADPDRLAGPHRQVARQAIALVEEADDGDALRHRRRPWRLGGDILRDVDRPRLGRTRLVGRLVLTLRAAAGQHQQAGG